MFIVFFAFSFQFIIQKIVYSHLISKDELFDRGYCSPKRINYLNAYAKKLSRISNSQENVSNIQKLHTFSNENCMKANEAHKKRDENEDEKKWNEMKENVFSFIQFVFFTFLLLRSFWIFFFFCHLIILCAFLFSLRYFVVNKVDKKERKT